MTEPKQFTGRTRQRKTRWTVHLGDVVAKNLITVGGLGTIIAVLMVAVFLVVVAFPLFLPGSVKGQAKIASPDLSNKPLNLAADEYQLLAWTLFPDGNLEVIRLDNGKVMERRAISARASEAPASTQPAADAEAATPAAPAEKPPVLTAWHFGESGTVALGFADGSTRVGTIAFEVDLLDAEDLPERLRSLAVGKLEEHDGGLLERLPNGQLRLHKLAVKLGEPVESTPGSPVRLIQGVNLTDGPLLAVLSDDGRLILNSLHTKRNFLTKKATITKEEATLPFKPDAHGLPAHMLLSGMGDNVLLAWPDGRLLRYDTRDLEAPKLAEEVALLADPAQRVTAFQFMLGNTTILVGDSSGRVSAWFRIKPPRATTVDGSLLVKARELPSSATAGTGVVCLGVSARSRIFAAGYADGSAKLYQLTSGKLLADLKTTAGQPLRALAVAPKDDGLLAVGDGALWRWAVDPGHPETTLLGVPIALLAAVFSSEFLQPKAKIRVKPLIELMASLPSVVLGFLAAIVIAPAIKDVIPAVLLLFVCMPTAMLLGGYLFQLLPERVTLRFAPYRLLLVGLISLPAGIAMAFLLGPAFERIAFAGNIESWLDGQRGSGVGGWLILLFPISAIAAAMIINRFISPVVRSAAMTWSRERCAVADLCKFLLGLGVALGLAVAGSWLLTLAGWDPRGTYIGTYVQRNALVVGFVMGFAIIPLIYTIADDALSAVPEQLRSASLGAGATPWQTASRIIIPTAMSGLFSAVMIGVGRAVGETMIVLMAAGNTPVRDLNMFNGFRTLSANIAVELPEAVRGSTHYRTLFLAALVLFVITFILNTVAEIVRQRFRKRAFQL
ncbi:MAG: ABC transporter permease subunit [Planctomycetota bacterium]|nr:ABC transporter permease subunit [Planctomycetota bacterium]